MAALSPKTPISSIGSAAKRSSSPVFDAMLAESEKVARCVDINKGSRIIKVGYLKDATTPILYRKAPNNAAALERSPNDEIAYLISDKFELGCVPPTMFVSGTNPYVLQRAVDAAPDCESITEESTQDALYLNIILGRWDARPYNSVADKQNNVKEVDNEVIGMDSTDSWLFFHENVVLSPARMNNLMRFSDKDIDAVFDDFATRHPPQEPSLITTIKGNFQKLITIFKTTQKMTIQALEHALYKPAGAN